MNVDTDWNAVAFHDAEVRMIVHTDAAVVFHLEHLFLFPEHPLNPTDAPFHIPQARLIFKHPRSVAVRAYTSSSGQWEDLTQPFPSMQFISEVLIVESDRWQVKGFAPNGQWLEWAILPGELAKLSDQ